MDTTILRETCERCQRAEAVKTEYAEMMAATEYDLQTVQGYLASALKLAIERERALSAQKLWNRILRDENAYLREALTVERDIRSEPDITSRKAA